MNKKAKKKVNFLALHWMYNFFKKQLSNNFFYNFFM